MGQINLVFGAEIGLLGATKMLFGPKGFLFWGEIAVENQVFLTEDWAKYV